jgi:hypothetical protein
MRKQVSYQSRSMAYSSNNTSGYDGGIEAASIGVPGRGYPYTRRKCDSDLIAL